MAARLGRGANMSIAKAALKHFIESMEPEGYSSIDWGCLDAAHEVVDIAGAKHCGPLTSPQVMSCLSSSPYWKGEFIKGFYKGFAGNGGATLYSPSDRGREYHKKNLM